MNNYLNDQSFFRSLEKHEFLYQPSEHTIEDVTPWRQSLRCILLGWLLSAAAIDASFLAQLLPVIGVVLLYLGFRSLRKENKWFRMGLMLTMVLGVWRGLHFAAACTIWYSGIAATLPVTVLEWLFHAVMLGILLSTQLGVRTVQRKADADPDTGHLTLAAALYVGLVLIPLLGTSDLFLVIRLAAAAALSWSLFKAYKHIGEAGFAIHPAPVKLRKLFVWLIAVGFIVVCTGVGILFFQQYPMQWETARPVSADVEAVRNDLAQLGMPAQLLADLSEEDILSLADAQQVLVGKDISYDSHPKMTTAAIEMADGWKVIHHFQWRAAPFYRGTEALELFYSDSYQNYTGRVLWDDGEAAQSSPYFLLEGKTYTNYSYFFDPLVFFYGPIREHTSVYAAFSFPWNAENCRGYVLYDCGKDAPGNGDFRYYYQKSPMFLQRIMDVLTYDTNGTSISESDPHFATRYGSIRFID